MVHIHNGTLISHKNEIMPLAATWIDRPTDYHTKWSKIKKGKYYHLYVESKKNYTNEFIYKTETDSQTLKTNLQLPKGTEEERDGLEVWD